jgi:hypothetical protein
VAAEAAAPDGGLGFRCACLLEGGDERVVAARATLVVAGSRRCRISDPMTPARSASDCGREANRVGSKVAITVAVSQSPVSLKAGTRLSSTMNRPGVSVSTVSRSHRIEWDAPVVMVRALLGKLATAVVSTTPPR